MKLSNSKSIVIQKPIGKVWKTTVGNRYYFPARQEVKDRYVDGVGLDKIIDG